MKYIILILATVTTIFSSCNYLDMVPEKDIETIETIFEKRNRAEDWLNTCYSFFVGPMSSIHRNPAIVGADEFVGGNFIRGYSRQFLGFKISDGYQMSQEPWGDVWSNSINFGFYNGIRYCNTFIEKIHQVNDMTDIEKNQWKAEALAAKALYYFELVRRYGPIVLIDKNTDVSASIEDMRRHRSPVDKCFDEIIRLLDESLLYLLPMDQKTNLHRGFVNREGAYALKAKVLVYAASPMYNGNRFYTSFKNKKGENMFSLQEDRERWRIAAEAIDIAIFEAEKMGRKLYDVTSNQSSDLLNTITNIHNATLAPLSNNVECLLTMKHGGRVQQDDYHPYTLPRLNPSMYSTDPNLLGCLSPGIKMVEMFYTENGLPINADNEWDASIRYKMGREDKPKYNRVVPLDKDVLNLHLRREPRFYANIAADRTFWQLGPSASKDNLFVEAYRNELFGTTSNIISSSLPQNLTGYWVKKMSFMHIGLKEYIVEVEQMDIAQPIIRLAELYLMSAECWNEYEGPSEKVYNAINKVRARAGIPDVVTSWKNYSKSPDKVDSQEGMRDIIRTEMNIEFAFEGQRFWNLRRWLKAHEELNSPQYGWYILGSNARSFYNNYEGPIEVWSKNSFVSPRDYLFPIRDEEILLTGCVQNPEW